MPRELFSRIGDPKAHVYVPRIEAELGTRGTLALTAALHRATAGQWDALRRNDIGQTVGFDLDWMLAIDAIFVAGIKRGARAQKVEVDRLRRGIQVLRGIGYGLPTDAATAKRLDELYEFLLTAGTGTPEVR